MGVVTRRERKRGRRGGEYLADGEVGAMGADGGRVRSVPGGGLVGMDDEEDIARTRGLPWS